jgi:hypothetical protein
MKTHIDPGNFRTHFRLQLERNVLESFSIFPNLSPPKKEFSSWTNILECTWDKSGNDHE